MKMENVKTYTESNLKKAEEVWHSTISEDRFEKILHQLKILKNATENSLLYDFQNNQEFINKSIEKFSNKTKLYTMCENLEKKLIQQKLIVTEIELLDEKQVDAKVFKNEFKEKILVNILEIAKMLQNVEKLIAEKNFHEASRILVDVKIKFSVNLMENDFIESSKIFSFLQQSEQKFKKIITEDLKKEIKETVIWKHPEDKSIVVLMFDSKNHNLDKIVKTLNNLGLLNNTIEDFAGSIMKYIIKSIVCGNSADVVNDKLVISKQKSNTQVNHIDSSKNICENLLKFLTFIGESLVSCEGGVILLKGVGKKISLDFLEIINKDILEGQNNDDKKLFENLVKVVHQLKNTASKFHLIEDSFDSEPLIEDATLSYISSKCRHHLITARKILTQPLIQSISAVVNYTCEGSLMTASTDANDKLTDHNIKKDLGEVDKSVLDIPFKSLLQFPDCQISKSIQDYWENVETMIREVGGLNVVNINGGREKLLGFIRHIVDLYSFLLPILHQDEIENIAFAAALHHNNSFYIAHQLLLLHCKLVFVVDKTAEDIKSPGLSWIDMVEDLRKLGMEGLSKLLKDQKEQFETLIRNEAVFCGLNRTENVEKTERCIRMINMKLQHMLRSWLHVLPFPVCVSNIGGLLGVVLKEILSEITKVEDFSEVDSKKLVILIGKVHDNTLSLFSSLLNEKRELDDDVNDYDKEETSNLENNKIKMNKNDVLTFLSKNVENWEALLQVKWVLGARLMDISDRWAGGKGPLAEELSAAEVERLVKALFKNTEMRSQVLTSIKNSA